MRRTLLPFSCAIFISLIGTMLWFPEAVRAAENAGPVEKSTTPDMVVTLNALDKITARVSKLEVVQDVPARFGTLEIIMRTCSSTPPEELPETAAFLEIRDILNNQEPRLLFTGWMFASSPSVSALEHPVYDVWVANCSIRSGGVSESRE